MCSNNFVLSQVDITKTCQPIILHHNPLNQQKSLTLNTQIKIANLSQYKQKVTEVTISPCNCISIFIYNSWRILIHGWVSSKSSSTCTAVLDHSWELPFKENEDGKEFTSLPALRHTVHRIIRDFLVQLCSKIKYTCPDNGLKSCSCETSLCRQLRSWELPVQTDHGIHVQFCTFCTLYMGPETNDPTLKHLCCWECHKQKSRRGHHRELMWLLCKNSISLMKQQRKCHSHQLFHVLSKLFLKIWFYHEQAFHEVRFNNFLFPCWDTTHILKIAFNVLFCLNTFSPVQYAWKSTLNVWPF